jgi:hypothetical protein
MLAAAGGREYKLGMPQQDAASLGQLAVLCRLITEAELARLRRLIQQRARGPKPTSLARLLIKAGFGARTVRRLLRLGADLAGVRCDGCGRGIAHAELPGRRELPCPGCGALVLGFASFRKATTAERSVASLWESTSLPSIDARPAPLSDDPQGGVSTVHFHGVLGLPSQDDETTLPFDDVLALPRVPGRAPRSEEETIVEFEALVAERRAELARGTVKLVDPTAKRAPEPEQRIGDWLLLRELGEGGVGKVHLARHVTRGDRAALKVLKADVVRDREYVERFKREADAALRIQHPNVVAVVEAGVDAAAGKQFIAYEYLDGGSLLDLLAARGFLPDAEALRIVRGIALALAHAETHGIIHRDLKPENILLTSEGVAKLADLGLMKEVDRRTRLTMPGIVVGTPCYMAPEQAMGEERIDVRADIYALGLCLWQMLAGSVPFEDEDMLPALELMTKHIEEDLPDVRLARPSVSDATAQVVRGMTARKREERYPNPQTLVRDLELALAGKLPLGPRVVVPAPPGAPRPPSGRQPDPVVDQDLAPTIEMPGPFVAPPPKQRPVAFVLLVVLLALTLASCGVTAALVWNRLQR